MKDIHLKLLLNRVQYDCSKDLSEIFTYFHKRGISLTFNKVHSDIHGYAVKSVQNSFGNFQNVLTGGEELVKPYLDPADDICALVIQGFKEFGDKVPSESSERMYIPGTKTVLLYSLADDNFEDEYPNFKVWLMHEIMHALCTIANIEGFPVVDSMDRLLAENGQVLYYHLNYDFENPNSNFIRTFESFYASGFLRYN